MRRWLESLLRGNLVMAFSCMVILKHSSVFLSTIQASNCIFTTFTSKLASYCYTLPPRNRLLASPKVIPSSSWLECESFDLLVDVIETGFRAPLHLQSAEQGIPHAVELNCAIDLQDRFVWLTTDVKSKILITTIPERYQTSTGHKLWWVWAAPNSPKKIATSYACDAVSNLALGSIN